VEGTPAIRPWRRSSIDFLVDCFLISRVWLLCHTLAINFDFLILLLIVGLNNAASNLDSHPDTNGYSYMLPTFPFI
jgi:hypothetical protein